MSKANSKTHKDMAVSRVPVLLAKRLEQDAKGAYTSTSNIIRRILLDHYGLLKKAR